MSEQLESDAHSGGHGTRAVIAALLANLGIAVAKFVGFVLTGASSMLAEAVHSVADSGNQAMLLAGGRLARRGPDPDHPFGHGSVRYFAAFLVAVVLFTLGSLYDGAETMVAQPRPLIEVLAEIPDFRDITGKRHPLAAILRWRVVPCCVATGVIRPLRSGDATMGRP